MRFKISLQSRKKLLALVQKRYQQQVIVVNMSLVFLIRMKQKLLYRKITW